MKRQIEILLIGGSAGSIEVMFQALPLLNPNLKFPIVVILHRKKTWEYQLSDMMQYKTTLVVREPEDKEVLKPGHIYLAPADYHLLIEKDKTFSLDYSEKENYSRPSINITFLSALDVFNQKVAGVLLSGANADGVSGLRAIEQANGVTIIQNPQTAQINYMPKEACKQVNADYIVEASQLAQTINALNL